MNPTTRGTPFFGWYVVAGCFLMAIGSWGLGFYGPGVYLAHLTVARGWPVASVSFAITLYFWIGAVLIMTSGPLLDRLGPRGATTLGVCATFVSVAGIAHVTQPWQLYPAFALLAVGWATMSSAAINATLAPWFVRRRGLALSVALTGASFGGIVLVPALTAAIRGFGFESGVTFVAGVVCALILAATWPVFVRAPALRGLLPDGDAPSTADPSSAVDSSRAAEAANGGQSGQSGQAVQPVQTGHATRADRATRGGDRAAPARAPVDAHWGLRRVFADRGLITITLPFAIGLTAQVGLLTHLLAMLVPLIGADQAAWMIGATTASAVAGRFVAGALLDRVSRRRIAAGNFGVQLAGLLLLAVAVRTDAAPGLILAGCLLFGAGVGNMIAFPGLLVQQAVPSAHFARVTRLVTGIGQISFATGPSLMGWLRQTGGSYQPVLTVCIVLFVLAAVLVLSGPEGRRDA